MKLKSLKIYIPIAIILLYFVAAVIKLKNPGLQYDEVLFTNAALGVDDKSFVTLKIWNIPVLLMPYIGALKAWLYFPIFNLVTPSPILIRLPMILLTTLSLFLIYRVVSVEFNKKVASAFLLIFATSASLIVLTRLDVGPNAIELFLKCLTLFLLSLYLRTKKKVLIVLILLSLSLGLFNKLNFLWFINSLYFATFVLLAYEYIKTRHEGATSRLRVLAGYALSYIVFMLYFFYLSRKYALEGGIGIQYLLDGYDGIAKSIITTISGTAVYNYAFGDMPGYYNLLAYLMIVLILAGYALRYLYRNTSYVERTQKYFIFLNLILFSTIIQILLTKQATAPWHAFTLFPIFYILVADSIYLIYENMLKSKLILLTIPVTLAILNLGIYSRYIAVYDETVENFIWSNAIYDLVDYTKANDENFAIVDWGIHTQLITLDPVKDKYFEEMAFFNDNSDFSKNSYPQKYFDEEFMFIVHTKENAVFKNSRQNLFALAELSNKNLTLVKTIYDGQTPIFEIYKTEK